MKSKTTRENNVTFPRFPTLISTREKNIDLCYFPECFSRVSSACKRTRETNPGNEPEKKTLYIYVYFLPESGRQRPVIRVTPKDGVKLRRRLQGTHPMTSKKFQTGGAA